MVRSLFGTDGVRGRANTAPMTAEMAMRIGMAAGQVFRRGAHRNRAVIGKDTRLSGYMLEQALTAHKATQIKESIRMGHTDLGELLHHRFSGIDPAVYDRIGNFIVLGLGEEIEPLLQCALHQFVVARRILGEILGKMLFDLHRHRLQADHGAGRPL